MREASPGRQRLPSAGAGSNRSYALALSVMRLTAPLPNRTNAMPFISLESEDSSETESPDELLRNAPIWESEGAPCGVGALSVLPSSFGSIYASETFRSFISVFNQSTEAAESVSISVHMQTSSQRIIPLLDTSQTPRPVLQPRASINNIVKIPLPELGVHKLLCSASYRDPASSSGQVRTLRQVFRFNVLPPLEPTLTVTPLYKGLESFPFPTSSQEPATSFIHYLVDMRVLNAVPVPVYVTEVTFVPKPPFRVRPLHREAADTVPASKTEAAEENDMEGRQASMGVGDTRNFLFHVCRSQAKSDLDSITSTLQSTAIGSSSLSRIQTSGPRRTDRLTTTSSKLIRSSTSNVVRDRTGSSRRGSFSAEKARNRNQPRELGHLTISWRSAHGEIGHLDNVVTASEPVLRDNDIDVEIYAVPEEIHMHRPFVAHCAARNNTNHPKRLYLQVRRDLVGEIVPVGVSGVSLGEVQPGCTARCSITLIPLVRGQHTISGVRVVDIDSNMSYKAEPPMLSVT